MGNECDVYSQSYSAGADLSAKQYLFMRSSAAGAVNTCGLDGKTVGVLQNKPTSGLAATVRELGRSKLVVDGNAAAIAAGDYLGSDAAGKGIKVTADHKWAGARAEEASTADGDVIEVTVLQGFMFSV